MIVGSFEEPPSGAFIPFNRLLVRFRQVFIFPAGGLYLVVPLRRLVTRAGSKDLPTTRGFVTRPASLSVRRQQAVFLAAMKTFTDRLYHTVDIFL